MSAETKGPILSKEDPTKEQIANWKKEHNCETIHVIKIKDEKDKNAIKKAFLRTPTIDDLSRASASEKAKAGTWSKSLFENCVLQMHPDVRGKILLYNAAVRMSGEIEASASAELEQL